MARRLLLLLLCDCGFVVLLPARASAAAQPERCSMPKEVSNAEIKVDNNNFLNARLRYKCKEGYKRKAGTSSLIVCERDNATKMLRWTEPNITCIRDPSLPPSTSSPRQTTSASRTEPTSPVSEVSTHVMLSSVGFPVFLVMAAVVFCCLWRQRVHRRQQYALPLIAIPTTEGEAEQRHGTPSEDNNLNSPDQTTEGTEMMSSFCGTPTG
ncbi:interleukin-15 receptor subunit alpha isoform X3 [Carettochelys insculpta]|uniref:interleukin-15 receptor subunit alpha isoform X3 n=1 Tax=Carettochelys insculpta TaxID=44489 RepID=UPI003EBCD323